jgi:hypothetical protein
MRSRASEFVLKLTASCESPETRPHSTRRAVMRVSGIALWNPRRVLLALAATTLMVPAVISVGAIAFSFIPILKDGVWMMVAFMAAADGVGGIFFFVFLFAAPIALVLATIGWATLASFEGGRRLSALWVVFIPTLVGAVLLPPVWVLEKMPGVLPVVGPALLGALAGAAAGGLFFRIAMVAPRRADQGEPARV